MTYLYVCVCVQLWRMPDFNMTMIGWISYSKIISLFVFSEVLLLSYIEVSCQKKLQSMRWHNPSMTRWNLWRIQRHSVSMCDEGDALSSYGYVEAYHHLLCLNFWTPPEGGVTFWSPGELDQGKHHNSYRGMIQQYAASKNLAVQDVWNETEVGGRLEFLESSQLGRMETAEEVHLASIRCAWVEYQDRRMRHFMIEVGKCIWGETFHPNYYLDHAFSCPGDVEEFISTSALTSFQLVSAVQRLFGNKSISIVGDSVGRELYKAMSCVINPYKSG